MKYINLDDKLLPFLKNGAYIYIAIPGIKRDCHDKLPPELLLSWTLQQLDYMQDNEYAVGDRKAMEAGGGKYLNFISMILRKK